MEITIHHRGGEKEDATYRPRKKPDCPYEYAVERAFGKNCSFFREHGLPKGYGQAVKPSKYGGFDVLGLVYIEVKE